MSLLSTKELSIGYSHGDRSRFVQKEIEVNIGKGELVCLLGQNGVGKTTFIKTISGLLPPLGGSVRLNDRLLQTMSKADIARNLGLVLTERPAALNLPVIELIALGRYPYSNWIGKLTDHDMKVVEDVMDRTNIGYIADRKLFELSDGQFQIVMIARALAQETDLLILDEPTAHLDIHNKIAICSLLRSIVETGKSILISTHDIQISTQLADRLWLFNFTTSMTSGLPEDLILTGKIHKTFFINQEDYDLKTGLFQIGSGKNSVSIEGEGESSFWTGRALRRYGFFEEKDSKIVVSCNSDSTWDVMSMGSNTRCTNIHEVLQVLKSNATPDLPPSS